MNEEKQEKIMDAIEKLNWNDNKIEEIMEGFFNNPLEAIGNLEGCSEGHLQDLWETLELEDK